MAWGRLTYVLSSAVQSGGAHILSESDNEARLMAH